MAEFDPSSINKSLERIRETLPDVAQIITGDSTTDLTEVLPDPSKKETREENEWSSHLTGEAEQELRRTVEEIGPGRRSDYGPDEAGLHDYMVVHEGGQAHKILAQQKVIRQAKEQPLGYFYTGATERPLSEAEKRLTASLLRMDLNSEISDTEDRMIAQLLMSSPGFMVSSDSKKGSIPLEHPDFDSGDVEILKAGYFNGHSVWFMPVVRREQENTDRNQLTNQQKIEIVGRMTEFVVALATSSTYEPSNVIAAAAARARTKGDTAVVSYGLETLAKIKGEEIKEPSLGQIAAELHKTAKNLREYDSSR